ncbi:conserved hypothetical protein [Theileria orientalis strain Shintoku]|uniref:Uncharacterized protein n=1 Tax=Theileria orientalis strain Shintoku TaxID=869250 RepID=J4DAU9_THEOR|nr:conserved hypothetical protein [Theileria orientalis strain Shintoku]PVC54649.1 hypothetical protein MACL_00001153 [Theileria orientalis]BAM42195.1 conserved hypothetical protein [Theileria orientalis strain Shintoku]|eukprot:XP_009692496.1 conserved hypothetical protein [Theileria orientalis strain Shintoku]
MYSKPQPSFASQSTSYTEAIDDVVSSFGESLDSVIKNNFEQAKKGEAASESSDKPVKTDSSSTKNQKLAAIFCRQWLSGVLRTMLQKLSENPDTASADISIPVPSEPQFVDDQLDIQDVDELGVCVENAKVCDNRQIEVNYDFNQGDLSKQVKPRLKAQQLMKLILQGKDTEWSLQKKLEDFWKTSPGLLLELINEKIPLDLDELDAGQVDPAAQTVSLDEESMEFLSSLLDNPNDDMANLEEYLANNPKMLLDQADKLGIVGVDRLIELFNKLKKEIAHVNKMAKFFSKFAVELNSSSQVEIM